MATKIKTLISCEATPNFGIKAEGKQVINLVVACQFGEQASKFSVTGEKSVFNANLTVSDDDWKAANGDVSKCVDTFKKELSEALANGSFNLFGHLVTVAEATDGEHTAVKNQNTGHVIETFAQALASDSHDEALSFVKRNLRRNIESKRFEYED